MLKTKPKRSKFNNKITVYDGFTFDSIAECNYYKQLVQLKRAKVNPVVDIQLQVPYPIVINDHKICKYIADFVVTYADGTVECIDVKGYRTNIYKLKKKLVEALFGIEIKEVK